MPGAGGARSRYVPFSVDQAPPSGHLKPARRSEFARRELSFIIVVVPIFLFGRGHDIGDGIQLVTQIAR
jgi:hypothetical protein